MKSFKLQYIFIIFFTMIVMIGCQSKEIHNNKGVNTELTNELEINIDGNNVQTDVFSNLDVNSVLYENAIQNKEPVVDLFCDENMYAFHGEQIRTYDYNTKEELQTIHLEGLENVNIPLAYNELNPIIEETESRSNTYVTAFTVYENEYYVISDTTENTKSVTKILRFDQNGKLTKEYPIQINNVAEKIVIKNDKVIILSVNEESIHAPLPYYDLIIYNLSEEKQSEVDIHKVVAVTMTDNNKAAAVTLGEDGHERLLIMDMETQNIEKEVDAGIDYIMDLEYQNNKLFILTISEIYTMNSDLSTPPVFLLNDYVKGTYNRKIRSFEDKLVILHSSNNMLLHDMKALEQKNVDSQPYNLTILTSLDQNLINSIFGDYINELKKKYPNITLKILDVSNTDKSKINEYNEKVAKKLMAKDRDFDLYYMWDNDNIIKSNYSEDLSKYAEITNHFDEMLPGIKNLMSYKDKIYGVPTGVSFYGFSYHPEDLNDMGLQFPSKRWTLSDFYNFAEKNRDTIEKEQKPLLNFYHILGIDTIFNTNFYVSYLQGAELSSNDLASNFQLLKKMLDDDFITVDPDYKGETMFLNGMIDSLSEIEPHLAPVLAQESCKYMASIQYVALNPSSPNKELAAEFLATLTDPNIRKKSLFQDIGTQLQNNGNQLDSILSANVILNDYTELDGFESHKLYKELLEDSVRNIEFQGGAEIGYLFEEYMNGKRTAKSAADEIIQRLDMIKYE